MTRYAPGVYEELKAQGLIDNAGYPTNLNLSNGLGGGTPRGGTPLSSLQNIEIPQNLINPIRPSGGISGLMQTTQPTTTQQPSPPIQQQLGSSVGPIGGSMISSPYMDSNQDLDQYLNSYVENLINRRMRDIFGGIMSIFQ